MSSPEPPQQNVLDRLKQQCGITQETLARFEIYHALLMKWQKAINLVSPKTISDAWARHILDSAQLGNFIAPRGVVADLGSGGGFPGIVLAMMFPQIEMHLIESDARKCEFMRAVSREATMTNIHVHNARAEAMYDSIAPDQITARALASLDLLLEMTYPWAQKNKELRLCFLKGKTYSEEITQALKNFTFACSQHPSITEPEASILILHTTARRENNTSDA